MLVDAAELAVAGPHAHLVVPEGPWKAPKWHVERPVRYFTAGGNQCTIADCTRPAGGAEGDVPRAIDVLCVAHRRRFSKATGVELAEFIEKQASASPIRAPRGAQTRKPTFAPIDFTLVHPHLAHELRFVAGTKVQRRTWRSPHYLVSVLRAAIAYGTKHRLTSLLEFPAVPDGPHGPHRKREMFPDERGAEWNNLASALPTMLQVLTEATRDPWDSDTWHARDLGFEAGAKALPHLVWRSISCDWVRAAFKAYAKQQLSSGRIAWGTVANYLRGGSLLSQFMKSETGYVEPEDITRTYFLEMLAWIRSENSTRTDLRAVNTLSRNLTDMREFGIEPRLPTTVYLLRGENSTTTQRRPKPLPADILARFDDMVAGTTDMPPGVRLMLRVYRTVGPRTSECLELPRDALRHTTGRGYSLEYVQSKTQKLRAVPIPDKLGHDLAAHVAWVAETLGPKYVYMFPRMDEAPRMLNLVKHAGQPQPWTYQAFTTVVWSLYQRHGVTSSSVTGEVLTGCALHRFRHTIATGLLNEGWSQYEVQKFLGHDSPTMMQAYAEINDEKLRDKYIDFVLRSVDITGAPQPVTVESAADVERLRDRMVRATLPNGYCTLPEKQNCDFAPSPCLSCKPFFRTTPTFLPVHTRQRDESLRQLDLAREQGRHRAAEIHAGTVKRLDTIIAALEAADCSDAEVAAG